ncbi:acyl dehydratase [Oceaniglobus roseus]|uniref:acyl dehydratase n=1 Tax=Oceaniglobus roseus TaxID=1737570 RepID=UPI000C7F6916|nr:acyl dehydratase [Kandeliimicrobium roseum]
MSAVGSLEDAMDPARAAALWATLGREGPAPEVGAPLPPFFHHIHFWEARPPEMLGRDGHPRVGTGLIPDLGLPRRMWAGGALSFRAPLIAGRPARRTSRVVSAVRKEGRSGPLAFVTLAHEVHQEDRLCLAERQDLVYREDHDPSRPVPAAPPAPGRAERTLPLATDTTTLFRYSALTFNGHRIHYDEAYAREVEGYAGLVVHGPLLAQHLILMAADSLGPLAEFRFRLTSPLICGEAAWLCQDGTRFWVRGPDGRQCIEAKAVAAGG